MDIKNWVASIHTDLYHAGYTEDGSPYHAECYSIVIEREDGKRLSHNVSFKGCFAHTDEEGYSYFSDIRKEALAKAEHLLSRINEAKYINLDYWFEVEARYGSEYYCKVNNF